MQPSPHAGRVIHNAWSTFRLKTRTLCPDGPVKSVAGFGGEAVNVAVRAVTNVVRRGGVPLVVATSFLGGLLLIATGITTTTVGPGLAGEETAALVDPICSPQNVSHVSGGDSLEMAAASDSCDDDNGGTTSSTTTSTPTSTTTSSTQPTSTSTSTSTTTTEPDDDGGGGGGGGGTTTTSTTVATGASTSSSTTSTMAPADRHTTTTAPTHTDTGDDADGDGGAGSEERSRDGSSDSGGSDGSSGSPGSGGGSSDGTGTDASGTGPAAGEASSGGGDTDGGGGTGDRAAGIEPTDDDTARSRAGGGRSIGARSGLGEAAEAESRLAGQAASHRIPGTPLTLSPDDLRTLVLVWTMLHVVAAMLLGYHRVTRFALAPMGRRRHDEED